MSRRRESESSLELFLDTICNTFGGILFILLFVVLSLRMTGKKSSDGPQERVSAAEFAQLQTDWADAKARYETLCTQRDRLEEFASKLTNPEAAEEYARWRELLARGDELTEQILQLAGEAAALDAQRAENEDRRAQENEELETLRRERDASRSEIKKVKSARQRDRSLPQMREVDKLEVGLVLRYRRLYVWHNYSSSGNRLGLNTDDFLILGESDSGKVLTAPKPWGGIEITDNGGIGSVENLLKQFSPEEYIVVMTIWPDSFDSYAVVREHVKRLGFDIRPMTLDKDGGIVDRGGGSSQQVQ